MTTNNDGHRLAITDDDHGGIIVLVTAVALSWTVMVMTIRLVTKLHVKSFPGLEELGILIASCTAIASSAAVFLAVNQGLGKKQELLSPSQIESAFKALYASDLLYIFALGASKCGMLPLLKRLTPIKYHRLACYALGVFTVCWSIVSLVIMGVRCKTHEPWNEVSQAQCSNLFPSWVGIETVSMLIEIGIFAVAVSIIYILKMRWEVKVKVLFAFATRLPIIAPTILRLIYLKSELNPPSTSGGSTFTLTNSIVAQQTILHYTVMAASFAYLKPFLSAFECNMGATVNVDTLASSQYYGDSNHYHKSRSAARNDSSAGVSLNPLKSFGRSRSRQDSDTAEKPANLASSNIPTGDHIHQEAGGGKKSRVSYKGGKMSHGWDVESNGLAPQPGVMGVERMGSSESRHPIITKTQEWDIRTEERSIKDSV